MIERRVSFGFGSALTPTVRALLMANAAVYVVKTLFSAHAPTSPLITWFALWPARVLNDFTLWQLVTYSFLHGTIWHLFFNLFTLWMFGCAVEQQLGSKRFLYFYLGSGVGAGLFHLLFNAHSAIPVIGASGAVYAVLVAFALYFPNREVTLLLFFVLPVNLKAKFLVAIFLAISLISGIESSLFGFQDGIAHLAHLGGALTGFFLLRGAALAKEAHFVLRKRREWRQMTKQKREQLRDKSEREEIDRLLDRINEIGFDALSNEEKKQLFKSSKNLKKR